MSDEDQGALGRLGERVQAAVQIAGVAANVGVGHLGLLPHGYVPPTPEDTAQVLQVEAPEGSQFDAKTLIDQAGSELEAKAEGATDDAVELSGALAEPESAWYEPPPDLGAGWLETVESSSSEVGESWGDPEDALGAPVAEMSGDLPGGAW